MKSLSIKNNNPYLSPVKLVNLIDFDPKKLSINVAGTEELRIYYVKYDDARFYLVVDDVKGFIEENSAAKYLTVSFLNKNVMYTREWDEIKKLCRIDAFSKYYSVMMFESSKDVVGMINISTMTIIVKAVFRNGSNYFPQVCLNYCSYDI